MYGNFSGVSRVVTKKIVFQLRISLSQSSFFARDLEETFVPALLQHLECEATKLHVYTMADALNKCSRFISIILLVIVASILK